MLQTNSQISLLVCTPDVARSLQRALTIMLEREPSFPIEALLISVGSDHVELKISVLYLGIDEVYCWGILPRVHMPCRWCFLREAHGM
jgi:hypothetical protein